MKQEGYLVEATLWVEENQLERGLTWRYWYGVKQRQKEISASATRVLHIPKNPTVKGKCWHVV